MPAELSASMSRYTVRSDTSSSSASACALTRPRTWSNASIDIRRLARMPSILAGKSCHCVTGLSARMDGIPSNEEETRHDQVAAAQDREHHGRCEVLGG